MPSYNLIKLIKVEKTPTSFEDGTTPMESYEPLKYIYAQVTKKSGGMQITENGIIIPSQIEVTIRYDKDIDYHCRFVIDNQIYRINDIYIPGRNDWQIIECTRWEN